MQEKGIKQDFWIRGQLLIVDDVPAGVCPQCGESIVNAETGRRIAALVNNAEQIAQAPRIAVPEIKFEMDVIPTQACS